MSQYVKSTSEGQHWSVYIHKPQRGTAYAMACEGEYDPGENGRFASFTFMMFQNRTVRVNLEGNNTAKNRTAALTKLRDTMLEAKMIAEDAPAFTG